MLLTCSAWANGLPSEALQYWPQWRGPMGTGSAPLADPPLTWSERNNVKWKVRLPGSGTSTPIVWGQRVFILTAVATGKKVELRLAEAPGNSGLNGAGQPGGMEIKAPSEIYQFVVLCLDRNSGQTLWEKVAREEAPHQGHHPDHGYASGSPVTDGQCVFAYFGSRGLHCYDMEGNLKWTKDFGPMQTKMSFGEGSSPALYGETVVIYRDDEADKDFIAALDKRTGKELWRTPRNESTGWSTPLVVEYGGKQQVVVSATGKVRSYDLATGKELWQCGGQTANAIPTPVASTDTVYVTSGFRGNALYALALDHTGDLTGTDGIRWSHAKNTPYVPSPLLAGELLYTVSLNNGVLSCFDAKSGVVHFEGERLEGISGIYASPVASKDRVYILGRDGTCLVLKKSSKLEVLAKNKLEDRADASLALAGQDLLVRGHQYLYCVHAR